MFELPAPDPVTLIFCVIIEMICTLITFILELGFGHKNTCNIIWHFCSSNRPSKTSWFQNLVKVSFDVRIVLDSNGSATQVTVKQKKNVS